MNAALCRVADPSEFPQPSSMDDEHPMEPRAPDQDEDASRAATVAAAAMAILSGTPELPLPTALRQEVRVRVIRVCMAGHPPCGTAITEGFGGADRE